MAIQEIHKLSEKEWEALLDEEKMPAQNPLHKEDTHDPVEHPAHYTAGEVECIDAIRAAVTGLSAFDGYLAGNVIKYVWRHAHKGGDVDLRKARWYLDRLIGEMSHAND